jgi:hypothetical protein
MYCVFNSKESTKGKADLKSLAPFKFNQDAFGAASTIINFLKKLGEDRTFLPEKVHFIKTNMKLILTLRPRDYCIKDIVTDRQNMLVEHVAKSLVLDGAVKPMDVTHAITTIGSCVFSQNHFVEVGNRFLLKLFAVQNAIRKQGLWHVWEFVQGECVS